MKKEEATDIKVLIETEKYIITGKLVVDIEALGSDILLLDDILLYVLNCGKKFISLHDCIVANKEHAEFQPDEIEFFHVNLDIVQTCRIIEDN